ncbi:MAG: Lrp/AsnC family transcriptional regulator [Solirubrobacteraceae bacterium]
MDATDRRILALLVEDGRRSLEELSRQVRLSAPAVKRRIDRLRAAGPLRGFTAIVDDEALGWHAEAFVELFLARDATIRELLAGLRAMPEALGAWTVSGDADALAHVRARDNHHLEQLLLELRRKGLVERTRSQIVLSRLLTRVRASGDAPAPTSTAD